MNDKIECKKNEIGCVKQIFNCIDELYQKGYELYYIGAGNNLKRRISDHLRIRNNGKSSNSNQKTSQHSASNEGNKERYECKEEGKNSMLRKRLCFLIEKFGISENIFSKNISSFISSFIRQSRVVYVELKEPTNYVIEEYLISKISEDTSKLLINFIYIREKEGEISCKCVRDSYRKDDDCYDKLIKSIEESCLYNQSITITMCENIDKKELPGKPGVYLFFTKVNDDIWKKIRENINIGCLNDNGKKCSNDMIIIKMSERECTKNGE